MPSNRVKQTVGASLSAAAESANAARQEWEQFGATIAGSRWFNGAPKVELASDGRVVWKCSTTGCDGEMLYTGADWPTGTPGHHHECNSCGFRAAIKGAIFGTPIDE